MSGFYDDVFDQARFAGKFSAARAGGLHSSSEAVVVWSADERSRGGRRTLATVRGTLRTVGSCTPSDGDILVLARSGNAAPISFDGETELANDPDGSGGTTYLLNHWSGCKVAVSAELSRDGSLRVRVVDERGVIDQVVMQPRRAGSWRGSAVPLAVGKAVLVTPLALLCAFTPIGFACSSIG